MCTFLKKRLMKIVPMPSATMHRRLDEIQTEQFKINKELSNKLNELNNKLTTKLFYNNDSERKNISSFYGITESKDFKNKFLSLIRGMDNKSVETVVRIIKRQQLIKGTEGKSINLYSLKEQEQLGNYYDFISSIMKIDEDLYCYDNYLLPINYFEFSIFHDLYGLNNVENIDYFTNKDIIDVGAFIGDSALILSPLTKKKIYSFEPVEYNYNLLIKTIELNKLNNIVVEKLALGSKNEIININVSGSGAGSSIYRPLTGEIKYNERIKVTTLDEYIASKSLNIGLIKVDIEGFELEFLKGAEKTIRTQKPILLLSIYHNPEDFFTIKPLIESWNIGYKFKIYKAVDNCISIGALLIAELSH